MRRHTFVLSTTCLLLTTLILAACGDRDDDDDGTGPVGAWPDGCRISEVCNGAQSGEVAGSVSGAVNEFVSGGAVFAEEAGGSWFLVMGTDYDGESGIFFAGEDGRPATGTYAFDATSAELGAFYIHGESDEFYLAEEGELTVTQSSPSVVAGEFEFTASDEQGNVVTVDGTFSAPNHGDAVTIGAAVEDLRAGP